MAGKNPDRIDELLTVAEVAKELKLAPKTVRKWIAEGTLPGTRLGDGEKHQLRVSRTALDTYRDKHDELAKLRARADQAGELAPRLALLILRRVGRPRSADPKPRIRVRRATPKTPDPQEAPAS